MARLINRPLRALVIASVAAATLLGAVPAKADSFFLGFSSGGHRHHHRHHRGWHHRHYYGPRITYYSPPVYYPPPPVVYAPPPVYVQPQLSAPMTVTPTSPVYRSSNGQYCREYQGQVLVGGLPQPSYGTACLQPDGSWRIVN